MGGTGARRLSIAYYGSEYTSYFGISLGLGAKPVQWMQRFALQLGSD